MASQPHLQNNSWLPSGIPWAHYIGRSSGSDGTDAALGHGPSGNQATFPIQVAWDDVPTAITDLLGVYTFDSGTKFLQRTLPLQHPLFKWLRCTRVVSIKPMKWDSKQHYFVGAWSHYTHALLSLLFTQLKYPVVTDTFLDTNFPPVDVDGNGTLYRQEWLRWTERTPNIGSELFTLDQGTMFFVEGGNPGGPAVGAQLNVPVGQPISVGDFLLVWRHVPMFGLFSSTTYRPENLILGVNKVNTTPFLGYPAETLLFAGYNISYNEVPYPPESMGIVLGNQGDTGVNQLWPSLTCDVTLQMRFKDPPPGGATRGWNLQPWRGDLKTGLKSDFKWYRCNSTGLVGGALPLGTYDFRKLFAYAP